jgi:hypothetical protein
MGLHQLLWLVPFSSPCYCLACRSENGHEPGFCIPGAAASAMLTVFDNVGKWSKSLNWSGASTRT